MKTSLGLAWFILMVNFLTVGQDTVFMVYKNKKLVTASSELNQEQGLGFGEYSVVNIIDQDGATAWVEGKNGAGLNEYVCVSLPFGSQQMKILSGYFKSEVIFEANNRPKEITVQIFELKQLSGYATEYYDGYKLKETNYQKRFTLKDEMVEQILDLTINWDDLDANKKYCAKIIIRSVYKGEKWDDTCISEVSFTGEIDIALSSDQRTLFKITDGEYEQLFFSPDFVYDLIAVGPNKRYCILTMMPAEVGEGRVETIYILYDTEERRDIEIENLGEMFSFVVKDKQLFIEGLNKNTLEVELFKIASN